MQRTVGLTSRAVERDRLGTGDDVAAENAATKSGETFGKETVLDNTEALDRFFAGVERRAFHMARIATGNVDDALDLVQDAMVQLVQRYRTRPEEEWPPLFYRILQNRIRDWYRRQKVRLRWQSWFGQSKDDDSEQIDDLPDPSGIDPAAMLAGHQSLATIEEALQNLPLRQQQVFLLRAWEGLDVAETARALGIGNGSVKTHYSRAVHRLRVELGDVVGDESK